MKHVANKVKMTLAALVCACMMLTGVPAVAFAAAGEAASDAVGSLGDAIESLAVDAGEDPAITPLADEEPDYSVTTVVFNLTNESYLKPQLCFSNRESSIQVDWGDGTTSNVSSGTGSTSPTKSKAYASIGTYTVTISSAGTYYLGAGSESFPFIYDSNYRRFVTSIVAASNAIPRAYSFYASGINSDFYTNLTTLDVSACDTSSVTNMGHMFQYCRAVTELDVSGFDTSKVTDMSDMFHACDALETLDLSGFDTSKVTNMSDMFYSCDVLAVLNLSGFDTAKVTDMSYMFGYCPSLTSLDVSGFETSKVTTMKDMFYKCTALTSLDVSAFVTSNVTDMSYMFDSCESLTSLDLSNFDTSKVTTMQCMISGYSINDSNSTTLNLKTVDISSFDTSNVTDMSYMFYGCKYLAELDLSGFDTSNVTTMYKMFYGCSSLTSLDLSGFDTSSVKTMYEMFYNCSSFTSLDISGFDTSSVETMYEMFYSCSSLTSLDTSSCDTSSVETMYGMFYKCNALTSLDLSSFDTSKVTSMYYMFRECSSLTSLDISGFDTSKVTSHTGMFQDCTQLREVMLANTFSFGSALPTPSSKVGYETTGKWVNIATGEAYASADIPNDTAATYYAQAAESALPLMFDDDSFDVANTAGFTGTEIVPSITTDLLEGTEYTVSYDPAEGWNIGDTVTLTFTGVGNYADSTNTYSKTVTLEKALPPVATPTLLEATYGDTLSDVVLPDEELGTWTWDDGDTQSVGDAGVHYFGATFTPNDTEYYVIITASLKVTVWRMPVDENMFTVDTDEETYTGASITKAIESDLTEDADYRVRYSANTRVGQALITIQGIGNYRSSQHSSFTIAQRKLAKADFSVDENEVTYTGSAITRDVVPTGYLQEGRDYTVVCTDEGGQAAEDPTDAGTYTITVTADGTNCSGSLTYSYTIARMSISDTAVDFSIDDEGTTYTGAAITKAVSGAYNEMELVEDTDYTVDYYATDETGNATGNSLEPQNVGAYAIIVTGIGNYTSELTKTFQITAHELKEDDFDIDAADVEYTGAVITKDVTPTGDLEEERDYTIAYSDATTGQTVKEFRDVGTYTITIGAVEDSNCTGKVEKSFKITQHTLVKDDFEVTTSDDIPYTGNADEWSVQASGSLQEDRDYTVVCTDENGQTVTEAVAAGTYTITVAAVCGGNCKNPEEGPLTYSFTITQCELSSSVFYLDAESRTYTGADRKTVVKVTRSYNFVEGSDYTVTYLDADGNVVEECINVGDYIVRVSALGPNCTGSVDFDFTVSQCTISNATFTYDPSSSVEYTGAPITKEISGSYNGMELIEGTDYTVSYENNVDYGNRTASITIEGIGNYSGTRTHYFSITRHTLSADDFTVDTSTKTYTGSAITKQISPTGSLVEDRDYFVSYESNTEVGTAVITITGDGTNCTGSLEYHFTITSNYLTSSSFKVDTSNATYTGSAITKKITPVDSLVEGRDYVVAYANNVGVGTASIIITGINNCFGQVTYTFKIVKPAAKLHAQSIKLAKKKMAVKAGKKATVKVKGAKTKLVAKPKGKKAKKALKVKVKGKKKLIVRAKPNAKRGTYKVKVYAKRAGSYAKSKTVKLKVKVQ